MQLGQGDADQSTHTTPVQVLSPVSWKMVSLGSEFTCGITSTDACYCWGYNKCVGKVTGRSGRGLALCCPVRLLHVSAVAGNTNFPIFPPAHLEVTALWATEKYTLVCMIQPKFLEVACGRPSPVGATIRECSLVRRWRPPGLLRCFRRPTGLATEHSQDPGCCRACRCGIKISAPGETSGYLACWGEGSEGQVGWEGQSSRFDCKKSTARGCTMSSD